MGYAALISVAACRGNDVPTTPPDDEAGIVVLVDEAHENFHTVTGALAALAEALREVGMTVRASGVPFTDEALADADVLVIVNALDSGDVHDWSIPIEAAFTAAEVQAVRRWVDEGGGLLLVADHMPFPAAAASLAAPFGVHFTNGFALDTAVYRTPSTCLEAEKIHLFRRSDGSLGDHAVVRGPDAGSTVDSVGTFTGQAFTADPGVRPLLTFNESSVSLYPDTAWAFRDDTPVESVEGWLQGAATEYGAGRAVFFGEAAMITEQRCDGDRPMGWNAPRAAQNRVLALNVVRWLAGTFD